MMTLSIGQKITYRPNGRGKAQTATVVSDRPLMNAMSYVGHHRQWEVRKDQLRRSGERNPVWIPERWIVGQE